MAQASHGWGAFALARAPADGRDGGRRSGGRGSSTRRSGIPNGGNRSHGNRRERTCFDPPMGCEMRTRWVSCNAVDMPYVESKPGSRVPARRIRPVRTATLHESRNWSGWRSHVGIRTPIRSFFPLRETPARWTCSASASAQVFSFFREPENASHEQEILPPKPLPTPPKSSTVFAVLPYLWSLAADDPLMNRRLLVAVVLLVLGKAAGLSGPLFFKKALDSLSQIQTAEILSSRIIYYAMAALVFSSISKALSAASMDFRNVVFAPVGQSAGRRLEYHLFNHILGLDLSFHLDRKTGSLARIIERGKRSIVTMFRAVVFTFLPTAIELLVVCIILANHVSLAFSGIVFVTFAAYVAWTIALTKASVAIRKEVTTLDNMTTAKVVDVLINYETVVQFDNQKMDLRDYDRLLLNYQDESVRLERVAAALNTGQMIILSIGLSCAMVFAGWKVVLKTMTVGDLVLVNGLIAQLSLPLQFLGFYYRDFRQSLVDIESMFSVLNTPSTIQDGHLTLPNIEQGALVKIKNVKFSYKGSVNRMVLKGISFNVQSGENVAIVGRSGSGKSTIVKLLLRLYESDEGTILVDDLDINSLTMSSLRQAVAVVPQDTVLFNDTILYNIAYGRLSATFEEIKQAAIQAELHESIQRMPDGYQTLVGERGLKLSGGEKQRVAIARAFLKSPRLLICDEATSALDSSTEVSILKSLKALSAGRSCIFVAHRLSTIKHCDKILVMDKGEIIEQGRHEELLQANGHYASMWQLQESQTDFAEEETEDQVLANYSR